MRFTEFTEINKHILSEEPALAYSPSEFTARYGMTPAQAEVVVDNVVKLNPGYSSPAVKDSVRKYLLDNPKVLQSANDNIKPPTSGSKFKINPGSLLKGIAGRAPWVIGMILTPSDLGDGTITPAVQLQWDIEKHLKETDPAGYVRYLDDQWAAVAPDQREGWPDPRTTDEYKDALKKIELSNTGTVRPEGPAAGMPQTTPTYPTSPGPEIPVIPAPEIPVAPAPKKPEVPKIPEPEVPVVPAPKKPAVPAPEVPVTPVTPEPKKPAVPAPAAPRPNTNLDTGLNPNLGVDPRLNPNPAQQGPRTPRTPRKWPDFGLTTPNLERIPPKLIQIRDPLNLKRNA